MKNSVASLTQIQQLVLDIHKIERNHNIPGTEKHENVVDHCFSVSMMCWKLYNTLKPDLDFEKVLKYCLAHDFLERGLLKDVNTYADAKTREAKKEQEERELEKLEEEFTDFPDMLQTIKDYENMIDEESKFVHTIDKMQAIILGEIDDWRPYKRVGITHRQFTAKGEEFEKNCPDFLLETLREVNQHSRKTFYDQPKD
tara:strand:+ start:927 stop:1523 length:597 start_codon:yes stop_codon:yes gene_type:complete